MRAAACLFCLNLTGAGAFAHLKPRSSTFSAARSLSQTPLFTCKSSSSTCEGSVDEKNIVVNRVSEIGRRQWLSSVSGALISVAGIATMPIGVFANDAAWGPKGDPTNAEAWFPLIKLQYAALVDLYDNWDSIVPKDSSDGDAVRRKLGTIGVSSPLSAVKKAYVGVRDSTTQPDDVDLIEFAEAFQEVLTDLSDAENDCYSANFADFSGGGQLKGYNFLKKAKKSIKLAVSHFKEVMEALKLA